MTAKKLATASLFTALITLGAYISIPTPFIPGVPFTLQILIVILAGVILEANYAALSLAAYILLGLAGVPVFHSGTAGPGILAGPTGGYIFGFLAAAYMLGWSTKKFPWAGAQFGSAVIAVLIIHLLGLIQLTLVTGISPAKGLVAFTLPFLPVDLIKVAVAVPLGMKIRRVLAAAGLLK